MSLESRALLLLLLILCLGALQFFILLVLSKGELYNFITHIQTSYGHCYNHSQPKTKLHRGPQRYEAVRIDAATGLMSDVVLEMVTGRLSSELAGLLCSARCWYIRQHLPKCGVFGRDTKLECSLWLQIAAWSGAGYLLSLVNVEFCFIWVGLHQGADSGFKFPYAFLKTCTVIS